MTLEHEHTATAEKAGTIVMLKSEPSATATIDGKVAGTTPLEMAVSPGTHSIELARDGYTTRQSSFVVASGERKELTFVPRQSAARSGSLRCRSSGGRSNHRWRANLRRRQGGRCFTAELRKLRKRFPTRHSFAPTEIGGNKPTRFQSLANFFFRKCAQTSCAPVNVDHRHDARFYLRRSRKVNTRVESDIENHARFPFIVVLLDLETVKRDGFNIGALLVTRGVQRLALGGCMQTISAVLFLDIDITSTQ